MNIQNYFTYKDEVSRTISWGHWFLFLNIFLALLIGCGYLYDTPKPSTGLGFFYLVISWLGHFSSIVFIVYLVLFFPLSFIGSLKYYRIISIVLSVLLFLVLLIDVKLYQAIKIHISSSVLDLFIDQEGFSTGLNFNFLYIATPILLGIEIFFSHLSWKHIYLHRYQKLTYFFSSLFLISFFSTHVLHIWANAYKYVPITIQKTLFPAYYPMTANTFLAEHGWIHVVENETIERKDNLNLEKINYPLETLKITPYKKPYNVLLILIDGLSANFVTEKYMPNLTKFAKEHDSYLNHYIGSDDSYSNVFELTYGLPGQYLSLIQEEHVPPVLVTEMLQQDYKIKSFITANSPQKAEHYAQSNGVRTTSISSYPTDVAVISAANNWLTTWSDRPQLTVVSLNSPDTLDQERNAPLNFVPQLTTQELKDQLYPNEALLLNRYYNCLWNLDFKLAELIATLKDTKQDVNTVIIITSTKGFNSTLEAHKDYSRQNYHVPLIISWPNGAANGQITALSSSQDIAPTLLKEVLGVKNNINTYSTGQNLRELTNRDWILSGNKNEIHIISLDQTTVFDKHGNAVLYSSTEDNKAPQNTNMSTLIKAMKLLNKFKENN